MKIRSTRIILAAALSTLIGSLTLSAQDTRTIANIPFAFVASGQILPAGQYSVADKNSRGLFMLRDSAGHALFVNTVANQQGQPNDPKLVFLCYGKDRLLMQVWLADGRGYSVSKSAIEKALGRHVEMGTVLSVRLMQR